MCEVKRSERVGSFADSKPGGTVGSASRLLKVSIAAGNTLATLTTPAFGHPASEVPSLEGIKGWVLPLVLRPRPRHLDFEDEDENEDEQEMLRVARYTPWVKGS